MLALAGALVALVATHGSGDGPEREVAERGSVEAKVLRVVDGDTALVRIGRREETIRYIGIDTPESVKPGTPVQCFGHEASLYNGRLVQGRRVMLGFGAERRDVYGRLLAYVHRGHMFVNARLVAAGFARTLEIAPNDGHAELFDRLQEGAASAGRGLWSEC